MHRFHLVLLSCLFLCVSCTSKKAQKLDGVYRLDKGDLTQLWMFVDGYSSLTTYASNTYQSTEGGPYTLAKGQLQIQLEYNDQDSSKVGQVKSLDPRFKGGQNFEDNQGNVWVKQPHLPQDLDGAWKISGRQKDGKFVPINHSGGRKTLKLLKDGYFQWVAIDPDKKAFFGTGGGHYTFTNGTYTEELLFFSRDNARVGAKLNFKGELKDGEWHHSGESSKGDPIYEIWTKIN